MEMLTRDHPTIERCERTGEPYAVPSAKYIRCCMCGENIYIGLDAYYDFEGAEVCEDCMSDYVWEHYRRCS